MHGSNIERHEPAPGALRLESWDFERVDAVPYLDEDGREVDHRQVERNEQLIAWQFVAADDRVLELGGRYGTVACLANNRLADPTRHVVIEPDARVIPALLLNRASHNAFFTVYRNVIAREDLVLSHTGYDTRTVPACCGQEAVPRMSLDDVVALQGFGFTALIADCEGCFERFLRENGGAHLDALRMVSYEKDVPYACDYGWVAGELARRGFECVRDGFHMVWTKRAPPAEYGHPCHPSTF